MFKRCLFYVMNVFKTYFVCYECLKDVFLYVMDVFKTYFIHYGCFKRCLLYVMDVSKRSFVRCGCLNEVTLAYFSLRHVGSIPGDTSLSFSRSTSPE